LTDPKADRQGIVNLLGSRTHKTCEWIEADPSYESWRSSTESQLLWVSGGPGKGKTTLSIFVAEKLEREVQCSARTLFLQYFCDNQNQKRNTVMAVLRGLIYQLLKAQKCLYRLIEEQFQGQDEKLFLEQSFPTLWEGLQEYDDELRS
jgi:hypothetical protein